MDNNWNNTTNSNQAAGSGGTGGFDELFKNEYAVILLQGKNTFGDKIYSYVEVTLPNIKRLYAALHAGVDFSPSDFGSIVASGTGEPSDELRQEMANTYKNLESINPTSFPPRAAQPIPAEKKAWDEF